MNILPIWPGVVNPAMISSTYTQPFFQHTVLVGSWGSKCIFVCPVQRVHTHSHSWMCTRTEVISCLLAFPFLTNNFLIHWPTPFRFDKRKGISLSVNKEQRIYPVLKIFVSDLFLAFFTVRKQIQWAKSQWLCLTWYTVWVFQALPHVSSVLCSLLWAGKSSICKWSIVLQFHESCLVSNEQILSGNKIIIRLCRQ